MIFTTFIEKTIPIIAINAAREYTNVGSAKKATVIVIFYTFMKNNIAKK